MKNQISALIYPAVLAGVFTLAGYFKKKELEKLQRAGIRVQGVVVELVYEESSDRYSSSGYYYPVIRFLTPQKEWVTEKYGLGLNPPKYRKGDSVPVIYDPDNVKEFIIDDNSSRFFNYIYWAGLILLIGTAVAFIVWELFFL